jgi:hypothetical protein
VSASGRLPLDFRSIATPVARRAGVIGGAVGEQD